MRGESRRTEMVERERETARGRGGERALRLSLCACDNGARSLPAGAGQGAWLPHRARGRRGGAARLPAAARHARRRRRQG
eukprot:6530050-Prymnesium_polylepis.1